jgi:hypothetical protein
MRKVRWWFKNENRVPVRRGWINWQNILPHSFCLHWILKIHSTWSSNFTSIREVPISNLGLAISSYVPSSHKFSRIIPYGSSPTSGLYLSNIRAWNIWYRLFSSRQNLMLSSINAMHKKANMCNFLAFLSTLVFVQNISQPFSNHSCYGNESGGPNTRRIIIPSSISSATNSILTDMNSTPRLRVEQLATTARRICVSEWDMVTKYFKLP